MKKTFGWFLVPGRRGASFSDWMPRRRRPRRPPATAAEQAKPVEDPLGRSTPHGTVVGLINGR